MIAGQESWLDDQLSRFLYRNAWTGMGTSDFIVCIMFWTTKQQKPGNTTYFIIWEEQWASQTGQKKRSGSVNLWTFCCKSLRAYSIINYSLLYNVLHNIMSLHSFHCLGFSKALFSSSTLYSSNQFSVNSTKARDLGRGAANIIIIEPLPAFFHLVGDP